MIKEITRGMKKHKVTGMSVALQDGGEIVWAEGFGYANKERNTIATPETLYKAGSISKVFTATATMQLAEQGLIDIDAPIQSYIPELKPKYHFKVDTQITLRQIMTHRSGLSGDLISGMFNEHPKRFDTVIDYMNSVHAPYAPGTISAYSNIATDLQGVVIERVTGVQFENYIKKNILTPLNMHESTFDDAQVNQILMSKGYKRNRENKEYPIRNLPAGNLYTNVIELSRFANMVMENGGPVLKPESLSEMLSEQKDDNERYDMGMKLGLNWVLDRPRLDHLGRVAWHNGGTLNFMSVMIILPDQGLSIVVLSNTAMSLPFIEEIADKILIKAAELKSGILAPEEPEPVAEAPCPAGLLKNMPGTYATGLGPVKIYTKGNRLEARVLFFKALLRHHSDGWLSPKLRLFGIIPMPAKLSQGIRIKIDTINDRELLIAEYQNRSIPAGVKIFPEPIPQAWKQRVGKYILDLPEGDFSWFKEVKLDIKENLLIAFVKIENQGGGSLILKPVAENMALIEGIGRGMQETIYITHENDKPVINYGGYRLVKK
ncbi:serine hydrolase domain-containing protein [Kaarinaea lacus]